MDENKKKLIVGGIAVALVLVGGFWVSAWWSHGSALDALEADNPTDEQIEQIASLLNEDSGDLMLKVGQRLRELGPRSITALKKQCREGEPQSQELATKLLLNIDEEAGLEAMESLVQAPDLTVRKSIVVTLWHHEPKNPRAAEILSKFADDPDPDIRASAAEALGSYSGDAATQALERMTRDGDATTARHAARQLEAVRKKSQDRKRTNR
jgi:HEAT repeat protein